MTDASRTVLAPPLPPIVYKHGHPTVQHPDYPFARVCLCCKVSLDFTAAPCVPGMVVHLIEPEDIAEHPEDFARSPWVKADAIAGARRWWTQRRALIVRGPRDHPRFQVCNICTNARLSIRELPVHIPQARRAVIARRA